jgi:thioesterase domain-containing protein
MTALFQAATVRQLSALVLQAKASAPASPTIEIRAGGSRPAFFFVPGVDGHVLLFHRLAPYMSDEQPLLGLHARGEQVGLVVLFDSGVPPRAISTLRRRARYHAQVLAALPREGRVAYLETKARTAARKLW